MSNVPLPPPPPPLPPGEPPSLPPTVPSMTAPHTHTHTHTHTHAAIGSIVESVAPTEESLAARRQHRLLLLELEAKKRAFAVDVPTLARDVRSALRSLGRPVRLFGETNADVRDRLRMVLARAEVVREAVAASDADGVAAYADARMDADVGVGVGVGVDVGAGGRGTDATGGEGAAAAGEGLRETTYTHASPDLIAAREVIAFFSLKRSRARLEQERRRREGMEARCRRRRRRLRLGNDYDDDDDYYYDDDDDDDVDKHHRRRALAEVEDLDASAVRLRDALSSLCLEGSQYGDPRPIGSICSSRGPPAYACGSGLGGGGGWGNPNLVATGSWSGTVRLWDGASTALEPLAAAYKGHEDRITGIDSRPILDGNVDEIVLATASIDLTAKVWMARRTVDDGNGDGDANADADADADADDNPTAAETYDGKEMMVDAASGGVGGNDNGGSGSGSGNAPSGYTNKNKNTATKTTQDTKKEKKTTGDPWKMEQLHHLRGHAARLCSVAFHPSGSYIGTTSHDHTFRLWDVSTGSELLLQDGHDFPAYGIAFHPDGSLCSTSDYGGVVHLWDLRTGRSVHAFANGHAGRVLCTDFSPHGLHLSTAGDDGTVRIWDMRRRRMCASMSAHSRLVTQLRWGHDSSNDGVNGGQNGEFLISASFDGTVRAWSGRDWKLWGECRGHEGKVMGADVLDLPTRRGRKHGSRGNSTRSGGVGLVSCGFDKTIKLWC